MDDHNRRLVWVVVLLLFVNAFLEAIGIGLVFPLIKVVNDPKAAVEFAIIQKWFALIGFEGPDDFVVAMAFLVLGVFTFKNIFLFTTNIWQLWFIRRNESNVSRNLLFLYLKAPYAIHFHRHSAELIRNLLDCVPTVYTGLLLNGIRFLTESLMAAAIVAALFFVDAATALIVSVSVSACAFLFYRVLRRRLEFWGQRQIDHSKDRLKAAKEILGIIKELKVLGKETFFASLFLQVQLNFSRTMVRSGALAEFPRLGLEVLMIWVIVGAILWHLKWGSDSTDLVASLGVFAAAAFRLMPSANRLLAAINNIRQHLPSVRVVIDDFNALTPGVETDGRSAGPAPGRFDSLRLVDVGYRYPNTQSDTLTGINVTIKNGESVAIVGPSGAGKTTLIDIILGLLSPTHGDMLINGAPVKDQLAAWQSRIGYVPQNIYLLDDSLRRNIALGVDEDEIDADRLAKTIKSVQLDDHVRSLPEGMNTLVGEYGIRLSGGQRQRIGIARALYREPQVLILDEATSALDNETEKNIARSIEALRGQTTLIIIAHRLSTVRNCDRIVFMKAGRIDVIGTFDELMQNHPDFRNLAELGRIGGS